MVILPEECYYLGYISKKQGFKGGMIAFFDVDNLENYSALDYVLVQLNNVLTPFFIEAIHLKDKNFVFLKFEGVDSGARAEELAGNELYLPLKKLPKLGDDEYYLHDLEGMEVIDETAGSIGNIEKILDFSKNPLLQLTYNGVEVLIPLIDEFVKKVDKKAKKIFVDVPRELLDINAS